MKNLLLCLKSLTYNSFHPASHFILNARGKKSVKKNLRVDERKSGEICLKFGPTGRYVVNEVNTLFKTFLLSPEFIQEYWNPLLAGGMAAWWTEALKIKVIDKLRAGTFKFTGRKLDCKPISEQMVIDIIRQVLTSLYGLGLNHCSYSEPEMLFKELKTAGKCRRCWVRGEIVGINSPLFNDRLIQLLNDKIKDEPFWKLIRQYLDISFKFPDHTPLNDLLIDIAFMALGKFIRQLDPRACFLRFRHEWLLTTLDFPIS